MKATIKYKDGEIEEREGFQRLKKSNDKISLYYENNEVSGDLTIPKNAIESIVIDGVIIQDLEHQSICSIKCTIEGDDFVFLKRTKISSDKKMMIRRLANNEGNSKG